MMQQPYKPANALPEVTPLYTIDQRVWLKAAYDDKGVQLSLTAAMTLMIEMIHRKIEYTLADLDGQPLAEYTVANGFDGPQPLWDQMSILSSHVDRMVERISQQGAG